MLQYSQLARLCATQLLLFTNTGSCVRPSGARNGYLHLFSTCLAMHLPLLMALVPLSHETMQRLASGGENGASTGSGLLAGSALEFVLL